MNMSHNFSPEAITQRESPLNIWTNPIGSEFGDLPDAVRFTAVLTDRKIYLWDYSLACHTDISAHLRLQDPYDSQLFLKGAAVRQLDGRFIMFQSHFLQSFKASRLTRGERLILISLLGQDWTWVDQYVGVTPWLEAFRKSLVM
jgi:hypothetical protein